MSVAWRKVWRDLWSNKLRTLLVVLATTTGVFALGMVFGLYGAMTERLDESFEASSPPHVWFITGGFDSALVDAVEREPGVVAAEGEARASFRWKLEGEEDWRPGTVIGRDDYETQLMYPIELLEGSWPDRRALAVERMSSNYFDLPAGTIVVVEVGRREFSLPIAGVVRHPHTPPPQMGEGDATFCATMETVAWLSGEAEAFNLLSIRMESFSQAAAAEMGERIDDRLESAGVSAGQRRRGTGGGGGPHEDAAAGAASSWTIVDPDVHWGQQIIDTVCLVLAVLGALSLGLSGFLIVNTMNASMVQEVWQIGVMKVVGATAARVMRAYLATALVYGLLALSIAVPLGVLASHLMAVWLLDLFNVVFSDFRVVWEAVALQCAVGLVVPMLAALVPVVGGARKTPREAIASHGLGGRFGQGWFDQLIGRIRRLPRPLALSLRNTFRRKARVTLTLLALAGGGAMFVMVMSLSSSFDNTLDALLDDFGFDAMIVLDRPYGVSRLREVAESAAGVERAEVWNHESAHLVLSNSEDLSVGLWGVPSGSQMFHPRIAAGRGLLPEDGRAVLLNNKIAVDEGFWVGDEIELNIGGKGSTWTVVGLIVNVNNGSQDNFVPFEALAGVAGGANRGERVVITFSGHAAEAPEQLVGAVREAYEAQRIETTRLETAGEIRRRGQQEFSVINSLLVAMAALSIVVGSAGLVSTMSMNAVERAREIGVMRAIGATSSSIVGVFVAEGMLIGLLSWLLSVPLSYPGARVFSSVVGVEVVNMPLDFSYPLYGLVGWLALVTAISGLASLWPALRATRVSVREALAYE